MGVFQMPTGARDIAQWTVLCKRGRDSKHAVMAPCNSSIVMVGVVQSVVVGDVAELGSGVIEIVETLAWPDERGVALYALTPDIDSHNVGGRAALALAAHCRVSLRRQARAARSRQAREERRGSHAACEVAER
jgi:hypothetical protein